MIEKSKKNISIWLTLKYKVCIIRHIEIGNGMNGTITLGDKYFRGE